MDHEEDIPEPLEMPLVERSTVCDHFYQIAGEGAVEGCVSVVCTECWHGCEIDLDKTVVRDGKLYPA